MQNNLSYARIIPREVAIFLFTVKNNFWSYIAGFLDADGSIYVQLKQNSTYRYKFQIAPSVVFYQKKTEKVGLPEIQKKLSLGYIRYRNDGMVELVINDRKSISTLLTNTLPHLILKVDQARLMIKIITKMDNITSVKDFISLAQLVDHFRELNYSKKRTVDSQVVSDHLRSIGLLTP